MLGKSPSCRVFPLNLIVPFYKVRKQIEQEKGVILGVGVIVKGLPQEYTFGEGNCDVSNSNHSLIMNLQSSSYQS